MAQDAIYTCKPVLPVEEATGQFLAELARLSSTVVEAERVNAHLQQKLAAAERKKRRKITRQEVGTNENGDSILYIQYDDGEVAGKPLIMNARGVMKLYLFYPSDCSVESPLALVVLECGNNRIPVMCFLDRMRQGRYIYQQLQTVKISFNPEISINVIYKLLEEWFFRERNSAGTFTSKVLPGWEFYGRTAKFLDNSPLICFPDIIAELRLRRGNFERVELTDERKNGYFSELMQFKESDTRLVIFLAPFLGLLKSLIDYFMDGQTIYVNLIAVSEIPTSMISSWIQVMNRDILSDGGIEQRDKERKQWLEQLSDETLILDVRGYAGESDYSRHKKQQFLAQCAETIRNQRYIPGTQKKISAALFSVSSVYERGAINIILTDHAEMDKRIHGEFAEGKCLEGIMTAVVDFIENNFSNVVQILRKSRKGELNQNIFSAVIEILQMFFEKEGIDVIRALQIPDNFNTFFENVDEGDDIVDLFAETVRNEIHKYKALNKCSSDYEDNVIYFDSDYLYFPGYILAAMYQDVHRGNQWKRALVQLKEWDYLSTSSPGVLIKKLQVGGVRRDFYAVEKTIFNSEGYVDIIDLAKEG